MRKRFRVEDPVFLDSMFFIRGELRADVSVCSVGRKRFTNPHGRKRNVCLLHSRDLFTTEKCKVREKNIPGTEPHGYHFTMYLADALRLREQRQQSMKEIDQARVSQAHRSMHYFFAIDQVSVNFRFQLVEKFVRAVSSSISTRSESEIAVGILPFSRGSATLPRPTFAFRTRQRVESGLHVASRKVS